MTLGLSSRLYAQEVAYIHCKEDCYAVDIQNNREFTVNKDTLDMGIGIVYNQADVDSITFTNPAVYTVRVGWWGDDRNGALNCYYESVNANMPDVSLSVFDGYCHDVMFPAADNDAAWQSRGIQKVGRKWRYVKNTLSGHHSIRIKAMEDNYNKGLATAMLKSMF